jgi:hypothetical protein
LRVSVNSCYCSCLGSLRDDTGSVSGDQSKDVLLRRSDYVTAGCNSR